MIEFETTVIGHIKPHIKDGEKAEFFNGTLFVTASKKTIRDVYITLCNAYRKRFVQYTHIGDDAYAFDFVFHKKD